MTEPIAEVQVSKVFLLVWGGYKHNTTFHSEGYGGFEIYFPF